PLYKGKAKGAFSGTLVFDPESPYSSLTGRGTWMKPDGITSFAEPTGFKATGPLTGGFYFPGELATGSTVTYVFGDPMPARASGAGALSKTFSINGLLADVITNFSLDCRLTEKTGLILGKRPRGVTTGPSAFSGIVLQEQSIVAGSGIFDDPDAGDTY